MNDNNAKKPLKQGTNRCIARAYARAKQVLNRISTDELISGSTQLMEQPTSENGVPRRFCWITQKYFEDVLRKYDEVALEERDPALFCVDHYVKFSIPRLARWFCVDMLPFTAYNGSEHVLRTGDTTFMRYQFKRGVSTTQERERFDKWHAVPQLKLELTLETRIIMHRHTVLSVGNRSIFFDENIFDLSNYDKVPNYLQYPLGPCYRLSPLALMLGWYIYNELLNRYQAALLKDCHFACGDFLRFSGYWYILVTDLKRSQLKWVVTTGSTGDLIAEEELDHTYRFTEFPKSPKHLVRRMSTDA